MLLNSRISVSLLITASLLAGLPMSAADNDYLNMLDSEAEDLQLDASGQLKQEKKNHGEPAKTTFEWDGTMAKEGFPTGLGQDAFEAFLHKYYYGTYIFFRKLNSVDKDTVYHNYSKEAAPHIDAVRQNVMTLLKQ
jgi:hypothetical protein